jgi:hypothetical protein
MRFELQLQNVRCFHSMSIGDPGEINGFQQPARVSVRGGKSDRPELKRDTRGGVLVQRHAWCDVTVT